MSWQFTPFVLPLVLAGMTSLAVAVAVWRRHPVVGAKALALAILAAAWWSLANAAEITSVRLEDKLFWANLEYLGITTIPVLWFTLASRYATMGRRPTRAQVLLLFIVPAITNVLVWTNDYHGLMRQNVRLDVNGPYAVVAKTYGPWFWAHAAYMYSLLAAGSVFFVRLARRASHVYRGQAITLVVAAVLPWVGNAIYLFGQSAWLRVDPTPIAFILSSVAAAWGLLRYKLFDLVPAAHNAVFASMRDGVMVIDGQGRIVDLNPAAQQILRCSERQAVGRPLAKALQEVEELLPPLRDVTEGRVEVTLGPASARATYDLSISPLTDGQGKLVGRVVTLRDISQRRRLEEQVRRSQKLEAVSLLAGGIAHHFNNLLTVVNGYSEFVLGGIESTSPLREDIEAILRAGTQAAELTRRLLVFSRFRKPQVRVIDLNETLRTIVDAWPSPSRHNVTLQVALSPDAGHVEADLALIEQMVANLVANAYDAMPRGGDLTIGTSRVAGRDLASVRGISGACEHYATLWVSDTGSGMTPEVQSHLFEPFFTTKQVGEGAGLGLAMVYGIVEELRGGIEVQTDPGVGTTVWIYLPQVETIAVTTTALPGAAALAYGPGVVMVVEDEVDVRRFVVEALQREGYTVLEASDGAEALTLAGAQDQPIDLVLTDMVMPSMDGTELVRRLRSLYPDTRALLMSGFPEDHALADGSTGTIPFLAKPFTVDEIRDAVQKALAGGLLAA